ncbi:retrovirus-related pol polyprotein from transposon TNT 1-94 [Tanacetum coccineum]
MDLCGPMRVQSINGKKYISVIVDDYSRFTWVKFLRSKDETPEFVINFLKKIQVGLNKTVRYIRTDNGMEFVNQVMFKYYEGVGIFHQKSVPRTPQQNGIVERRNRTLVEAARTMLIFSKASMFLWAEVVATACYTQNRSLIHTRHNKTSYELVNDKNSLNLTISLSTECLGLLLSLQMISGFASSPVLATTYILTQQIKDLEILFQRWLLKLDLTIEETQVTQADIHPSVNHVAGEPSFAQSTSGDVSLAEPNQVTQPPDHLKRWTNDSLFEPKNFKMAVIEDCWFQAMQDEIHEFDRLEVWELVPRPIYVMVIALRWNLQLKLDEYVMSRKNKDRFSWQRGYHQEVPTKEPLTWSLVSEKDNAMSICLCNNEDHAGMSGFEMMLRREVAQFLGDRLVSWFIKKQASQQQRWNTLQCFGCCDQILLDEDSQAKQLRLSVQKNSLFCDNKSAIALSCNNLKRYIHGKQTINLDADILTKGFTRSDSNFYSHDLGMKRFKPEKPLNALQGWRGMSTETTDTLQTLPPPPPPLQNLQVFVIFGRKLKIRKSRMVNIMWTDSEILATTNQYWNIPNNGVGMKSRKALKGLRNEKGISDKEHPIEFSDTNVFTMKMDNPSRAYIKHALGYHLKMELEIGIPSSSNVKIDIHGGFQVVKVSTLHPSSLSS